MSESAAASPPSRSAQDCSSSAVLGAGGGDGEGGRKGRRGSSPRVPCGGAVAAAASDRIRVYCGRRKLESPAAGGWRIWGVSGEPTPLSPSALETL